MSTSNFMAAQYHHHYSPSASVANVVLVQNLLNFFDSPVICKLCFDFSSRFFSDFVFLADLLSDLTKAQSGYPCV